MPPTKKKHLWKAAAHLDLTDRRYCLGVNWHSSPKVGPVDLDLQAVLVDAQGHVVDAVYFNNLEALGGAIGSGGDSQGDIDPGMDEFIWIVMNKLPQEIHLIIFVIAAYNHHSLRDCNDGRIVLSNTLQECISKPLLTMAIEPSTADCDVIGMIKRREPGSSEWAFVEVDEPAEQGSHFLDIMEPVIGDLIRKEIHTAPKYQKVTFCMVKGAVAHFQDSEALKRLSICLDADVVDGLKHSIDIDIAAVFYTESGECLGAVDGVNETMYGVSHSGETHYHSHEHSEENVFIDFAQVPANVMHMFIVLTINSGSFADVEHVHVKMMDQSAHELVTYTVPAGHNECGLVLARIFHTHSKLRKRWGVHAMETFFTQHPSHWNGKKAKSLMLDHLHHEYPDKVKAPHHHHHGGDHHHNGAQDHNSHKEEQKSESQKEATQDGGTKAVAKIGDEQATATTLAKAECSKIKARRRWRVADSAVAACVTSHTARVTPYSPPAPTNPSNAESQATSPEGARQNSAEVPMTAARSLPMTTAQSFARTLTYDNKKSERVKLKGGLSFKPKSDQAASAATKDGKVAFVADEVPAACADETDAKAVAKPCNNCSWPWFKDCSNPERDLGN